VDGSPGVPSSARSAEVCANVETGKGGVGYVMKKNRSRKAGSAMRRRLTRGVIPYTALSGWGVACSRPPAYEQATFEVTYGD